jgi:hypothetical protein
LGTTREDLRAKKVSAADTASTAPRRYRSRITKGSKLLPSVNEQSVWGRIMKDVYDAMMAHCGGADYITEPMRLQARRIAALEAELIHIEDRIAQARATGEDPSPADLDLYSRLANGQRRHCEALGWQRVPRDVTPTLEGYLASKTVAQRGQSDDTESGPAA